jgi:hypothetical protein
VRHNVHLPAQIVPLEAECPQGLFPVSLMRSKKPTNHYQEPSRCIFATKLLDSTALFIAEFLICVLFVSRRHLEVLTCHIRTQGVILSDAVEFTSGDITGREPA